MSDLTSDEEKKKGEESRSAKVAGWVLFILALVVAAIVLGPCDPAPEPIPAGPVGTTTGGAEVVPPPPAPQESSSSSTASGSTSTTGETSTTGTTS